MIVVSDSSASRMPAPARAHSSASEATSLRGATHRFVYCDYSSFVVDLSESQAQRKGEREMAQLSNGNEVVTPTKADAALAKESGRRLAAHLGQKRAPPGGQDRHHERGTGPPALGVAAAPACLDRDGAG